ncbi:hypothetical protein CGRA01v4_03853 [Colletotrichum graminicola]|nr:hypothetical protein CGRA01v4_03853 [Colletotrichum graminicola]
MTSIYRTVKTHNACIRMYKIRQAKLAMLRARNAPPPPFMKCSRDAVVLQRKPNKTVPVRHV